MDRVLIKKYIGQSMLLFLACAFILFTFAWVRVWVGTFFNLSQYQGILDQLKEFEHFAPIEFSALMSYAGQVALVYDEPIVILCVVIWSVARGSDVISGELGRGTLEMLLSQPISRRQLLGSHAIVSIGGLIGLCLLVWAGIGLGVYTNDVDEEIPAPQVTIPIFNWEIPLSAGEPLVEKVPLADRVDVRTYASPTFHLFAFGFFVLSLATLFSSLDRYRWRTVGCVVGVYIIQLVMFGLGKAAKSLDWLLNMSFFSCYKPQKMAAIVGEKGMAGPWSLTEVSADLVLPPLVYPLILIGGGIVFYIIAAIRFDRRDLPAPL
ncbi:ABC transporter permease subunit [Planctomycetes bacterium K23_9]|uniref:ABC-2 family transporter protein n=1 Tax=Stieleria marina TaxID=1930275 RepID=A0A517NZL8_9BACT|nr:ABC-2 family transporter protein [Planctomycetes bacterium K23_9]